MSDSFLTARDKFRLVSMRDGGRPYWRQIEEILLGDIANGIYPPDSQLPSEMEMAIRFDVNRHTVRRALAALSQRGVLLVQQGRGSFVVRDAIDYALGPRTRFSENLLRQGRSPETEILEAVEETANEEIARNLKVRPGRRIVRISTLGRANGRPISLGRHCFPAGLVPNMIELYTKFRSVTKALKQIGISDYRRISTRVTARLPNPEEAHLLRLGTSQPLLVTEGINADTDGRPIEYAVACFASDRVQLVVEDR